MQRFECPSCHEAQVVVAGFTDDAKTELRCALCDHAWEHGVEARAVPSGRARVLGLADARAEFTTLATVSPAVAQRVDRLKSEFLRDRPAPEPEVADFWQRYQHVFSASGLQSATPQELKAFANVSTGAHPGNMSAFNKAWNDLGDAAAAEKVKSVIEFLLRGSGDIEDRLHRLIDPLDDIGMTGFRESLLTKVLCITHPTRFLPILTYTSPAGGKREIARIVFGLELPPPQAGSWTRGRLVFWSNDLLLQLVGNGFADTQHASQFLWWAKDQ